MWVLKIVVQKTYLDVIYQYVANLKTASTFLLYIFYENFSINYMLFLFLEAEGSQGQIHYYFQNNKMQLNYLYLREKCSCHLFY